MKAPQKPRRSKAGAEAENGTLEKGRRNQSAANSRFHGDEANAVAQRRYRKLIDGGADAVDWLWTSEGWLNDPAWWDL